MTARVERKSPILKSRNPLAKNPRVMVLYGKFHLLFCWVWMRFFPPARKLRHSKGSALDGDKMCSAIKHSWQGKHPGYTY